MTVNVSALPTRLTGESGEMLIRALTKCLVAFAESPVWVSTVVRVSVTVQPVCAVHPDGVIDKVVEA